MIDRLKTELVSDPLGRGYAAMTAQQAADSLNVVDRSRPRANLSGSEVFQALDVAELNGLSDVRQDRVLAVLGFDGGVNLWGKEGALFQAYFGAQSTTGQALLALRSETVSRATEIGITERVLPGHVEEARRA